MERKMLFNNFLQEDPLKIESNETLDEICLCKICYIIYDS